MVESVVKLNGDVKSPEDHLDSAKKYYKKLPALLSEKKGSEIVNCLYNTVHFMIWACLGSSFDICQSIYSQGLDPFVEIEFLKGREAVLMDKLYVYFIKSGNTVEERRLRSEFIADMNEYLDHICPMESRVHSVKEVFYQTIELAVERSLPKDLSICKESNQSHP